MRSSSILRFSLLIVSALAGAARADWTPVTLASPDAVRMHSTVGEAYDRGVARLALPPYTTDWLLADVSFAVKRIFTNYSGDVSGRFIELASLTSQTGLYAPDTLKPVLAAIAKYQKADGHFGVDVDLSKPLTKGSAPIPMLWGNARLLVGLVTAAKKYGDENLLATARRLGDFYVKSADQLCSPARIAELRATGTGGDGYACCYFPAIEGLAMLYLQARDDRYLQQARKMAEFFGNFDALPTDHSHGNLCAWRGILLLYGITGDRSYLDRAQAKWRAAVDGGYVWPIGGVGEHWYIFHPGDEGCSESDWLRFNLELWRYTGDTRYLDMAERLLHNQYLANQCANGGYGWRKFAGDAAGPVCTFGAVDEWNFCCSFHGPLGLYFLKSYLAAGSDQVLFVNFPLDFDATSKAAGRDWKLKVRSRSELEKRRVVAEIEVAPADTRANTNLALWVRVPAWASAVGALDSDGRAIEAAVQDGYLRLKREIAASQKLTVMFDTRLRIEGRRFAARRTEPRQISRLNDVALAWGPNVLFAVPAPGTTRPALLASIDQSGQISLLTGRGDGFGSVLLPAIDAAEKQIAAAIETGRCIWLQPWAASAKPRREAFMCDLVVVPQASLPKFDAAQLLSRALESRSPKPIFGEHLEARADNWAANDGWKFTPAGLLVSGGEVGLLEGEGYRDYRFEFDLTLPKEGGGISGFVVRSNDSGGCIMYQIQSADTTFDAPQYKTKPNTLRPHVRRGGQWQIADPVALPMKIVRGEAHHVTVECRSKQVTVFIDGQKVHTQENDRLLEGPPGFRAAGAVEQGLFRNISVREL